MESRFAERLKHELRIGDVVLLRDYVPRTESDDVFNQILSPKKIDDYWMYYLCFKGFDECVPIPLNKMIIGLIPDLCVCRKGWLFSGTEFVLERDYRQNYDVAVYGFKLAKIKYLHQLQNIYHDLTGATLTITGELIAFIAEIYKDVY